jgi:Na+/H+ antiporter NhaD/arsenite permease-like protein
MLIGSLSLKRALVILSIYAKVLLLALGMMLIHLIMMSERKEESMKIANISSNMNRDIFQVMFC